MESQNGFISGILKSKSGYLGATNCTLQKSHLRIGTLRSSTTSSIPATSDSSQKVS